MGSSMSGEDEAKLCQDSYCRDVSGYYLGGIDPNKS